MHVSAYGDNGRVEWQEFGKWEVVAPEVNESGSAEDDGGWAHNNLIAQAAFHKAMFAWLEDDQAAVGTNLADALHECAVVLALYQSAMQRKPIEMAEFDPPADLVEKVIATMG